MTRVKELEMAVSSLKGKDLRAFRSWFLHFDNAKWEKQILKDQSGSNSPIALLARKALAAHKHGKSVPL